MFSVIHIISEVFIWFAGNIETCLTFVSNYRNIGMVDLWKSVFSDQSKLPPGDTILFMCWCKVTYDWGGIVPSSRCRGVVILYGD